MLPITEYIENFIRSTKEINGDDFQIFVKDKIVEAFGILIKGLPELETESLSKAHKEGATDERGEDNQSIIGVDVKRLNIIGIQESNHPRRHRTYPMKLTYLPIINRFYEKDFVYFIRNEWCHLLHNKYDNMILTLSKYGIRQNKFCYYSNYNCTYIFGYS